MPTADNNGQKIYAQMLRTSFGLERYLLIAGGKGELRQMAENRTVLFLHFYFLDITKTICLNCF